MDAALGPVSWAVTHTFAAIVAGTVASFATGLNRRFSDPSLTVAQVVAPGHRAGLPGVRL